MEFEVLVNGERVPCSYLEKPWIRNSYLRFRGETLVVVAKDERRAEQAVKENSKWIERHYRSIKNSVKLFERNAMLLGGKRFVVLFNESGSQSVNLNEEVIIANARSAAGAERLLERWLKERSMRHAGEISAGKAAANGIRFRSIGLCRGSRWGSCAPDLSLKFNRYLCMLPAEVAGYVVAHELAHTLEMNHSASFWKNVDLMCGGYRELRQELKRYDSYRRSVF